MFSQSTAKAESVAKRSQPGFHVACFTSLPVHYLCHSVCVLSFPYSNHSHAILVLIFLHRGDSLMINLDCQLDVIYNHHGNKPRNIFMVEFLKCVHWGGQIHPEGWQHHLMGWGTKLNKKEKDNWAVDIKDQLPHAPAIIPSLPGQNALELQAKSNHGFFNCFCLVLCYGDGTNN